MNASRTGQGFIGTCASLLLLAAPNSVQAFDYTPTPISKALAAHDLVLVAKVRERAGGMVKTEPVLLIKGKAPDQPIVLPDTWRPGTEESFGPVRFQVDGTYLFMLNGARAPYSLSKDFAAPAARWVKSEKEPLVRAVVLLHDLALQDKADGRKDVLAQAWDKETDDAKRKLLQEFWVNPADAATVPFLLRALDTGPARSSLVESAGIALVKHKYKEAIPELLKLIKKREWTSLYVARALTAQKVTDAYEPIMALIEDPKVGNREYFIETLVQLEDRRAIPFFIKLLPRNIRALDPAYGTYRSWSFRENEFAVEGLGRLRAKEAVEPLMQLLTLEGPGYKDMRTRVVWALGEIGPPAKKAIPTICELMQAEQISKVTATEALKKIERDSMKVRFLTCATTFILAIAQVCCTGGEKAGKSLQTERKNGPALKPPTIRVLGISPVFVGEDHRRIRFEAANPNDSPLPYSGYRADGFSPPLTKGVIAPHYHLEFRRDGAWKPHPIGWCGTGAGDVALPPGGRAEFSVTVPEDGWDAFKVGVDWFSSQERKGDPIIAWSDPVTRDEIEKLADKKPNDQLKLEKQKDGAEADLAQPKGAAPYFAFLELEGLARGAVAVSPNGKTVALAASGTGVEIALWDFETGALKQTLAGHSKGTRSSFYVMRLAFAPDGKTLASAGGVAEEVGEVLLWDLNTGQIKHRLTAGKHYVLSIAFSPDGKTIAVFTTGDANVRLFDAAAGKLLRELKLKDYSLELQVAFSPDLKLVASSNRGGRIQIYEANTGRLRHSLTTDDNWTMYGFTFSPDGTMLAARGGHLWNLATGKVIDKLRGFEARDGVWEFSPDGRMLAFSPYKGGITLWDIAAAKVACQFPNERSIHDIAFTPNGKHLVTSTGKIWNPQSGAVERTLAIRQLYVGDVVFSRDGKTLVTRHDSQTPFRNPRAPVESEVRVWDARTGAMRHLLGGKRFAISGLALTADASTLATWGKDDKVRFWDVKTGELRQEFEKAIGDARGELSPDGNLWALGGTVMDTKTAKMLHQLGGDVAAFSPDGKFIATGGQGEVNIWNAATGKLTRQLFRREAKELGPYSGESIDGLRFSPDGNALAVLVAIRGAMTPLGRVEIWDVAPTKDIGKPIRVFNHLLWRIYSPDARHILLENPEAWSARNDDPPLPKRNLPPGRIIAFSPDGKSIVTGDTGPEVKVWDAATIKLRATLLPLPVVDEKSPWADWVTFTPDGFFIGSAGNSPFMQWRVGEQLFPAAQHDKERCRPDLVAKAFADAGTSEQEKAGKKSLKGVFDPKDPRIRGYVAFLEKRGVKLVPEPSSEFGLWRIIEPKFAGGTVRVGICSFTSAVSEAQMREALDDFSWGWRHFHVPARLAMSKVSTEGFDKGKPDELAALEEKLRHAFFWHERENVFPLKNGLTNEVVDAGLDPKDERIGALVAHLGRNGIKLVFDKETGWRIVEPKHTDGILSVSIRSFPPPASEEQMRYALDINLYYELNVEAQIAMSNISVRDAKKGILPDGLQSKLQRLFHEYGPTKAKSSEKAEKASKYLLEFLKARGIDLRPAPNSTNVVQRMYSIGPDHDRRFFVGLNFLPPMTVDAFRKEHKGYAFPHELGGHFALFKIGGPNGNSTKEYLEAWKKVSAAFAEYESSSQSHSADRYFAYWLMRHPPDPKSREYEPVLLVARLPIEVLGRFHERAGDMRHLDELPEKIKSGKPRFTVELLDGFALTMETHHKDSIWNPDGRPIKHLQSIGKVDWRAREATVNGNRYRYEECALADVVRLLEHPEGKEPIHRLYAPLSGFEQTAKALSLLIREQLATDKEASLGPADGWKTSADGVLAVHFSVSAAIAKPDQPIDVTVRVRNVSTKPISIVRPFPWGPEYPTFRIRDSNGFLGFHGMPPPSMIESWWRVGGALAKLEPGTEFKDTAKLDWSNYPDLRAPGTYRFVFDYSYRKAWDDLEQRAKVKLWKGKIEELTATLEVQAAQQPKQ